MDITLTLKLDLSPALAAALERVAEGFRLGQAWLSPHMAVAPGVPELVPASAAAVELPTPIVPETPPALDASAPQPAAVAPMALPEEGKRWTPERIAIVQHGYPRGVPVDALLTAVNARPGPEISKAYLKVYARQTLGLSRPDKPPAPKLADAPAPAMEAKPVAEERQWANGAVVPRAAEPLAPVEADDVTIRQWAAARGMCNGGEPLVLSRVNAKRTELGLPPFARRFDMIASSATMRPGARP